MRLVITEQLGKNLCWFIDIYILIRLTMINLYILPTKKVDQS